MSMQNYDVMSKIQDHQIQQTYADIGSVGSEELLAIETAGNIGVRLNILENWDAIDTNGNGEISAKEAYYARQSDDPNVAEAGKVIAEVLTAHATAYAGDYPGQEPVLNKSGVVDTMEEGGLGDHPVVKRARAELTVDEVVEKEAGADAVFDDTMNKAAATF